MVKNISKFIETDAEYLRTCFFTPSDITEQDKKRIQKLRLQVEKVRQQLKNK